METNKSMKVYVSGPLTDPSHEVMIKRAGDMMKAGEQLYRKGHTPFVPHMSIFVENVVDLSYRDWLMIDFGWLSACDAIVWLNPKDVPSVGAYAELGWAVHHGLKIFKTVEEVPVFKKTNHRT